MLSLLTNIWPVHILSGSLPLWLSGANHCAAVHMASVAVRLQRSGVQIHPSGLSVHAAGQLVYIQRIVSRAGTEGSMVSPLICDRLLKLGTETLSISNPLNH